MVSLSKEITCRMEIGKFGEKSPTPIVNYRLRAAAVATLNHRASPRSVGYNQWDMCVRPHPHKRPSMPEIEINAMTFGPYGVGRIGGKSVMVSQAVPGDLLEVAVTS